MLADLLEEILHKNKVKETVTKIILWKKTKLLVKKF